MPGTFIDQRNKTKSAAERSGDGALQMTKRLVAKPLIDVDEFVGVEEDSAEAIEGGGRVFRLAK